MVFCQPSAAMVEFVSGARTTNSALYAVYATIFGLLYWVVVARSPNGSYDSITPQQVLEVVALALETRAARRRAGGGGGAPPPNVEVLRADFESMLLQGYGHYTSGWPTGW